MIASRNGRLVDVLKCPCCGEAADKLAFRNLEAANPAGDVVTALVLACPHCNLVLGASVNPAEYVTALLRQIHVNKLEEATPNGSQTGGI
ncbi:MAG: hypothetical protein Q8R02_24130 [Hyphomonadaceae bacterium]|nr:hypothetical protein [Hyphomonadaceae bacterium]